ncbi:MAG: hypothetical protein AAF696_16200 [Bacteroidota bacterium]
MILHLSAQAKGSNAPEPIKAQSLINGDFTIKRNANVVPLVGDGKDEKTLWNFDLKSDPNWSLLDLDNSVLNTAKLILTLIPKTSNIDTDVVGIEATGFSAINSPTIQSLQLNVETTVELDLLSEGYDKAAILNLIKTANGVIPMIYADDAIISFAELSASFDVKEKDCKYWVEAISEDTIADPGNRRPNYVLVSVSDACGKPVSGLTAQNFKIDALIVGPGGALVNIDNARESSRIPGFYFLFLLPIRTESWKAGVYIFGLAVQNRDKQGQTLTSVLMD